MKQGKLTNEQLNQIVLSHLHKRRSETAIGPAVGEDCAVMHWDADLLVMTTDPITAAAKGAGSLAVDVCCNDIASAGAEPVALLLTLLVPPSAEVSDIEAVVCDAERAANAVGADIVGGHTEITDAVTRIVISATAIGRAKKRVVSTSGMRSGDAIVMTKYAGLEGTLILARDFHDRLQKTLPDALLSDCRRLADCLSVLPESRIAARFGATAMHDITEGGVYGAVWEMAHASSCGAVIEKDKIPMLESTRLICREMALDPYRLISSGCLLIACSDGKALCGALQKEGIPCAQIGTATDEGVYLQTEKELLPLDPPGADEIYKMNF